MNQKDYIIDVLKNKTKEVDKVSLNGEIFDILGFIPLGVNVDNIVLILNDENETYLTVDDLVKAEAKFIGCNE